MEEDTVDLEFANIDIARLRRRGLPEAVYGEPKTAQELTAILDVLADRNGVALATRVSKAKAQAVAQALPEALYHERSQCLTIERNPLPKLPGIVGIVGAGTADLPVVEEAAVTLALMGVETKIVNDSGVAGLQRTIRAADNLAACDIAIVVAGMEGALPSVISGLLPCPIIAVPTSVGYGLNMAGLSALLTMLNSCSSGITVVNIDNGYGAACAATLIIKAIQRGARRA
ncbi:MAG: nickel pincer cofactor biosynthesis protein LarB [Verrucomicrobia bacterium]|nr:nickel pincer cofactor biosynthesis protein LarB [Verrucomicrobiota bacterium]MBV8481898.1 nickel pincer cofactor biosynthesis protein LarB [Verrucomicrobiota bacterium]